MYHGKHDRCDRTHFHYLTLDCLCSLPFVNSDPVERGLPRDATLEEKLEALEKQVELKRKLEPYVHRKGAEVLRDTLPPIYDNLLYLEPSAIQQRLMKCHKKQQKEGVLTKNFFR